MIGNLLIRLPNLSEQSNIARVISNIDRKIAINNSINTEPEKVAKLLYDYWFVQFDFPNDESKPYRQIDGVMVWDKKMKKEIPKGWQIRSVK